MYEVAFPLDGLSKSGGARVVIAIANALARQGLSPVLQVPDYASEAPFSVAPGVRVEILRTRLGGSLGKIEYQLRLVVEACRHADAVVATSFRTPWVISLSRLVNRSRARRLYLVQHYETRSQGWDLDASWPRRAARAAIADAGYRLPFRRVAVSSWVRDQLPHPDDVEVIANGVDGEVFRPGPDRSPGAGPLVVGCIGRRAPTKGWDVFRKAVELLDASRWTVRVASPLGPECVSLDGANADTIHPGDDAELAAFYRSLDVFVFPSKLEGFGLPVLEAMACGTPVVTAACGGISDFVTAENALTVQPGDPQALADALKRLAADPALRSNLRRAGLKTAAEWSLDDSLQRHVALVLRELSSYSTEP